MFFCSLITLMMALLGLACMGDDHRKRKNRGRDDVVIDVLMWAGLICTLICGGHGVLAAFN